MILEYIDNLSELSDLDAPGANDSFDELKRELYGGFQTSITGSIKS
jgi:hypothetical protein